MGIGDAFSILAVPSGGNPIAFATGSLEDEASAPEFVVGQAWIEVLQPPRLLKIAFADQSKKEIRPFDWIRVVRPIFDHRYFDQVHQKVIGAISIALTQCADGKTEFSFRQVGHIVQASGIAELGLLHSVLLKKQIALLQ